MKSASLAASIPPNFRKAWGVLLPHTSRSSFLSFTYLAAYARNGQSQNFRWRTSNVCVCGFPGSALGYLRLNLNFGSRTPTTAAFSIPKHRYTPQRPRYTCTGCVWLTLNPRLVVRIMLLPGIASVVQVSSQVTTVTQESLTLTVKTLRRVRIKQDKAYLVWSLSHS
jgi:hypothetical protein